MDLSRAERRNPYSARLARDGYTVHVRRGRPRRGEETGPTVTKSVRLPPEVWARLEGGSARRGDPAARAGSLGVARVARTGRLILLEITLTKWHERAATASAEAEVFGDGESIG